MKMEFGAFKMPNDENFEILKNMKAAIGSAAELKLSLMHIRSSLPDVTILVFEGEDDRSVYFNWIRTIDAAISYEPYTCKGKSGVLKLRAAVDRDINGLSKDVYFFIDRDFDDLRGEDLGESTYMTDGYSIENDLVNEQVVEEILKIELNCQGRPDVRRMITPVFLAAYKSFLDHSKEINFLLFCMRRLGIENNGTLPNSLSRAFSFSINGVAPKEGASANSVISPLREISALERNALRPSFMELDPATRYRGKFALSFMLKWLEVIAKHRRDQNSPIFGGMDMEARTRTDRLNVFSLAARTSPPPSLVDFVSRKISQCKEEGRYRVA